MRSWILCVSLILSAAVFLYFVPPFRVVSLDKPNERPANAPVDPKLFVEKFWDERLIPCAARAIDATELIEAVQKDREAAKRKYGRSVGLGGGYYYFVRATGLVVKVERDSVQLSVNGERTSVSLTTGPIFGNAVRDGTGLLNVNDFPNSQHFNSISSELNHRIEEQVLPSLRKMAVGASVRFVGCAEITDEDSDLRPLRVVPFFVESP